MAVEQSFANVDIKGLAELDRQLAEFPVVVQEKCLRQATLAASNVVKDEARERVPIRGEHMSESTGPVKVSRKSTMRRYPGYLRSKIRVFLLRNRGVSVSYGVGVRDKWAYYGRFLEFGTSKMPRKSFIGPAFDSTVDRVMEVFRMTLADRIGRAWKKLGPLRWRE